MMRTWVLREATKTLCERWLQRHCEKIVQRLCERRLLRRCEKIVQRFCEGRLLRRCEKNVQRFCERRILRRCEKNVQRLCEGRIRRRCVKETWKRPARKLLTCDARTFCVPRQSTLREDFCGASTMFQVQKVWALSKSLSSQHTRIQGVFLTVHIFHTS